MSLSIVRVLNPWKFKRDQLAKRGAMLRQRDGDHCARCRRPLRFDLPPGHEKCVRVEPKLTGAAEETGDLANLCLNHGRCNRQAGDDTAEVRERVRIKNEAELFTRARERRRA